MARRAACTAGACLCLRPRPPAPLPPGSRALGAAVSLLIVITGPPESSGEWSRATRLGLNSVCWKEAGSARHWRVRARGWPVQAVAGVAAPGLTFARRSGGRRTASPRTLRPGDRSAPARADDLDMKCQRASCGRVSFLLKATPATDPSRARLPASLLQESGGDLQGHSDG